MRMSMDENSRTSIYDARKMRMLEWDNQAVHIAHMVTDIPYHRDRYERYYLLIFDGISCDMNEVRRLRRAMLAY